MSTPAIRAALGWLIELGNAATAPTSGPIVTKAMWTDAIAAARAALAAQPEGEGEVELTLKEVEAQQAFTQLRDEILSLSDGVEVNEVLGIIDNHTPEWV